MNAPRMHLLRESKEVWRKKLDVRCVHARLGLVERRVLDLLVAHAGDGARVAWPSQDLLAVRAPASRQRVNEAIRALRKAGLLAVERRQQGRVQCSAYVVADTADDGDPDWVLQAIVRTRIAHDGWRSDRRTIRDHHVAQGDTVTGDRVADDDTPCRPGRHDRVADDDQKSPTEGSNQPTNPLPEAGEPAPEGPQRRAALQVQLPTVADNHVPVAGHDSRTDPEALKIQIKARTALKPPLPFTLDALLATLRDSSQGAALLEPFDKALINALTLAIRALGDAGCTLADLRLVGELWAAREGDNWHGRGIQLRQLAAKGFLTGQVATARRWLATGRAPTRPRHAVKPRPVSISPENLPKDYDALLRQMAGEPAPETGTA
jgi:hypothetical protein